MTTRPYRSQLRNEHAELTRRQLVDAAIELFLERGYAATTIDAIAERAGVSRRTVFSAVGGKAALLKLAFDRTLAGDDAPAAIADRPAVREMMQQSDPVQLLHEWIAMNAAIARRVAGLHHVLVVAADSDAGAAELLADTDRQRAEGDRAFVERLDELGALRSSTDVEHATAVVDLFIDPALYRRLVGVHGWPFERYVAHVQYLATVSLLDESLQQPPPTLVHDAS
jgi:AcrR family transcriptional regulator